MSTPASLKYRYKYDPEYRRLQGESVKARHEDNKQYPTYRKLTAIRKRHYYVRESVASCLARTVLLDKQLLALTKVRDELASRWKKERAEIKRVRKDELSDHAPASRP